MMESSYYSWTPPEYLLSKPPNAKAILQLEKDPPFLQNFARLAKWSPDGSVFLAQCENRTFELFSPPSGKTLTNAVSRVFPQSAPILDFIWYPTATVHDAASYCFIASVRECPVKLLDATDGRLRASYRIVDHRERQVAPHSLAFNSTCQRLYCGFEDAIEMFDISLPGEGTRLPTTPSKKSKDGLKGIISSIAFAPSHGTDLYAAGSLAPTSSNIALFTEEQGPHPVMFVSGGPRAGVTQLHFNPARPHIMYASFRKHSLIYSWDLRGDPDLVLMTYQPDEDTSVPTGVPSDRDTPSRERTNQKLRFDIDLTGTRLGVGDHLGNVSLFDLEETDLCTEWGSRDHDLRTTGARKPTLKFAAHNDAIGSVGFNASEACLLTVSGSRHFNDATTPLLSESDSDDGSDSEGKEGDECPWSTKGRERPQPVTLDATIKLWSF